MADRAARLRRGERLAGRALLALGEGLRMANRSFRARSPDRNGFESLRILPVAKLRRIAHMLE